MSRFKWQIYMEAIERELEESRRLMEEIREITKNSILLKVR